MRRELIAAALSEICPGGVQQNVLLSSISRWRIGGVADFIVEPESERQLCALRRFLLEAELQNICIGDTTNLLFSDDGLRAVCIRIGRKMVEVKISQNHVEALAGTWVPFLARAVQKASLTGAEHICGIPGSLGGLICMNGGSQRKSIGSSILSVNCISPAGELITFSNKDCYFGYRQSAFQWNEHFISAARLKFDFVADAGAIRREMISILQNRNRKFPRKRPNCGSVFKSNPLMYSDVGPPGAIIENLGLKGYHVGGASVSPDHGNFFINSGDASAKDMLALITNVKSKVLKETGYELESEVFFVSPDGKFEAPGSAF